MVQPILYRLRESSRSSLRQILVCVFLCMLLLVALDPSFHLGSSPSAGIIALLIVCTPAGIVLWLVWRVLRFAAGR